MKGVKDQIFYQNSIEKETEMSRDLQKAMSPVTAAIKSYVEIID